MRDPGTLVWVDLEMTGLDPDRDRILEIASVITNGDLRIVAEGPHLVLHQPEFVLEGMDEWNRRHHAESGLLDQVRSSRITEAQAEKRTLAFMAGHCEPGTAPLAGNSISHDRRFLVRHMPALAAHFHYRNVDVSTLKELVRRWYPGVLEGAPPKRESHRAPDDIRESIEELRYYRRTVFRVPGEAAG